MKDGSQNDGSQNREIDWEKMEPEYIYGLKSLRALGQEYGCSDTAIRKYFKQLGVKRDPTKRIKAKAKEKVRKAEVRKEVRTEKKISEKREIEISAQVVAPVLLGHRDDIKKVRRHYITPYIFNLDTQSLLVNFFTLTRMLSKNLCHRLYSVVVLLYWIGI